MNTIDDEDIRLLLMDDDPVIHKKAIIDLYDRIAPTLIRHLRKSFPGFAAHDITQVVHDAFMALVRKIEAHTVDLENPLKNLILKIAHRKALDLLRKRQKKRQIQTDYLDDVAVALATSQASQDWRLHVTTGRAKEIIEEFQTMCPNLPKVQRAIAEAMSNAFPTELSLQELCDEVEAMTGTRPTIDSAKNARQQVRKKFETLLT